MSSPIAFDVDLLRKALQRNVMTGLDQAHAKSRLYPTLMGMESPDTRRKAM